MSGNQQSEKLGKEPLRKLFFTMAIPSVLAQLINVLYNIVDRIYIARIPKIGTTWAHKRYRIFGTYWSGSYISYNYGSISF